VEQSASSPAQGSGHELPHGPPGQGAQPCSEHAAIGTAGLEVAMPMVCAESKIVPLRTSQLSLRFMGFSQGRSEKPDQERTSWGVPVARNFRPGEEREPAAARAQMRRAEPTPRPSQRAPTKGLGARLAVPDSRQRSRPGAQPKPGRVRAGPGRRHRRGTRLAPRFRKSDRSARHTELGPNRGLPAPRAEPRRPDPCHVRIPQGTRWRAGSRKLSHAALHTPGRDRRSRIQRSTRAWCQPTHWDTTGSRGRQTMRRAG
jgi:hypothetical protein